MEKIINEYKILKKNYEEFTSRIDDLIKTILKNERINYHQISTRLKEEDSLKKKIETKNEKYKCLSEITDIVGLRIITYFEDEVDKVAKIIEREFDVDPDNSIDKRIVDADKFGYQSLHYIVKCKENRCALLEWKKFKNIKFEIQIRSILQHAWAEIEHDIGYKGPSEIPQQEKRNFSRIAALLETADKEFVRLKMNLTLYEGNVHELIDNTPQNVLIDKASLTAYLQKSQIVKEILNEITKKLEIEIINENEKNIGLYIEVLNYVDILTIKELDEALKHKKQFIIYLISLWFEREYKQMSFGLCLFYLPYAIIVEKGSKEFALSYFKYNSIGFDHERDTDELFEAYQTFKTSR